MRKRATIAIPTRINLPGGYVVRVEILSDKEFNEIGSVGDWAMWDDQDRIIYLRKSRKPRLLLEDFVHEMHHVIVDWGSWVLD